MTVITPLLFIIAACAAGFTIWKSIAPAIAAIRDLRAQLAMSDAEQIVHVGTSLTRERSEVKSAERRPRALRHPQPKPVIHRLHQYPHHAHAA
ncbi:hypothetical protein ASE49_04555 [Novosphingobium sp. Leaf2]|nr:hypothetical protein ASE49_04555 [Novosphingobium sp. Leaf2]